MTSDDKKALSGILDCLSYAERELGLLDAPLADAANTISRVKLVVEDALKQPSRRRPRRR